LQKKKFVQLALQPCEHRKKKCVLRKHIQIFFAVLAWLQRQLNKICAYNQDAHIAAASHCLENYFYSAFHSTKKIRVKKSEL